MKKQEVIRCCSCGSSDVVNQGNGIGKCNHCGSSIILPKQNEEIIAMLNAAYVYRENFNYDLAIKSYQFVLEKDSNELSAYEGLLLSEYGIEYVKDSYSNKLIPTCHRAHFKSILEDPYYQTLITLASDEQKAVIEQKAKEIDKLQKAIERQLKNEESYDVFISYKDKDKNGDKTEDALIARQIYEELSNKNYRVFFAEKSLEDRVGSEYEPIIFKALHTSKIFILVGTSKENVEANWVRNEWSRFIDRVKTDKDLPTGCFIPVFKDMSPYDMPKINNTFVQGVDASKLGYLVNIVDGVTKLLKPQKEQKVLQVFDDIDNYAEFERIRKHNKKELKKKAWKDLKTNPHRTKEKWLYIAFMYSPYVLLAVTLGLALTPVTMFITSINFIFFMIFIALTVGDTIAVLVIHGRKYPLSALFNVVIPFATTTAIILYMVLGFMFLPFTLNGSTPTQENVASTHAIAYDGLLGYEGDDAEGNLYISINGAYSKNWYKKYIKVVDGERYLVLPKKIGKHKVIGYSRDIFYGLDGKFDYLVYPFEQIEMGSQHFRTKKLSVLTKLKGLYILNDNIATNSAPHVSAMVNDISDVNFTIYYDGDYAPGTYAYTPKGSLDYPIPCEKRAFPHHFYK